MKRPLGQTVLAIGLVIAVSGFIAHSYWHLQGGTHANGINVYHVWELIGMAIATAGAVMVYRESTRRLRTVFGIVAIAGGTATVGQAWDEFLHAQGIHGGTQMDIAHVMADLGLIALILFTVSAWLGSRAGLLEASKPDKSRG